MPGKEAFIAPALGHGRLRMQAGSPVQTFPRGNHTKVALHHMRFADLPGVRAEAAMRHDSAAKIFTRNRGDAAAHVTIGQQHVSVGVVRMMAMYAQRTNHIYIVNVDHVHIGDIHHVNAIEAATIPWVEVIERTHRAPANRSVAEARMVSKAHEEYKCRRPERTIMHVNRPRPPDPGGAIIEPTTVVIGRPAPGLIRHPGPAVVGLPHPTA